MFHLNLYNNYHLRSKMFRPPTFLVFIRNEMNLGELHFVDIDRRNSRFRILRPALDRSGFRLVRVEEKGSLIGRQLALVQRRERTSAVW
jgi:hypothetical protein